MCSVYPFVFIPLTLKILPDPSHGWMDPCTGVLSSLTLVGHQAAPSSESSWVHLQYRYKSDRDTDYNKHCLWIDTISGV